MEGGEEGGGEIPEEKEGGGLGAILTCYAKVEISSFLLFPSASLPGMI